MTGGYFREIKKHYPVGIRRPAIEFDDFAGIKQLNKLVNEKVVDQNNFERLCEKGVKQSMVVQSFGNIQ